MNLHGNDTRHNSATQALAVCGIQARQRAESLEAQLEATRAALRRAVPWLGRLIADGGHLASVAPNDAVGALQQAEAALLMGAKHGPK